MTSFPDEILRLALVRSKIETALDDADQRVQRHDQDYMEMKRYTAQFRSDPKEVFQNELILTDIERSGMSALREREKLEKMLDSPYFARIDFRGELEEDSGIFYIGSFTFAVDYDILVYDWRAPVASLFYDGEPGPAEFYAPVGRIGGELLRKRQMKISGGKLEYVLESSVNVEDEVLQRELAATSDEKMKSIIGTIQKEQNKIIRDEKSKVMIIQGVAGSGKTAVALHRIAYLLYRFKGTLRSEQVAILSPSKVFGDYIASVLPQLGEEPVFELSLSDIARAQLPARLQFQGEEDPLQLGSTERLARAEYKSTMEFLDALIEYERVMEQEIFVPEDYRFGRFTASGEWMEKRYRAYAAMPVKVRLREIAADVRERFLGENTRGDDLPSEGGVLKALLSMMKITDALELYRDFFKKKGVEHMLVMPEKKTLEWLDVYPFLHIRAWLEGLQVSKQIRHLLIDEMQDYTPVQYAVINLLFPCPKTILGDFGQSINPGNRNSLASMGRLYPEGEVIQLSTSYRSTWEIIQFAKRIMPEVALTAVKRHGEEVEFKVCKSRQEELDIITAKIRRFNQSDHATFGVLTRDGKTAELLRDKLEQQGIAANLMDGEGCRFKKGVSISSIRTAKGLEFDQVIIPFADDENYSKEIDKNLLYVACTRAMHELSLTCTGVPTDLIGSSSSDVFLKS